MELVRASGCGEFAKRVIGARLSSRAVFYGVCGLLFALCAVGTIAACVSMSSMGETPMPGGWSMSMTWTPMCGQTWPRVAASFIRMWTVMMIAMMLPSLAPVLWRYGERVRHAGEPHAGRLTLLVAVGYFAVWTALGMALFPPGAALATLEMQMPAFSRAVPIIAGVVVVIAGASQFTAWKAHYLGCCRQAPGRVHALPSRASAAWRYGLRLGVHCSYCCAGLTAVLVVIGVMDLVAMAAVTAAMTLERLAPRGERVARGIGFVVVGMGSFMIVRAAWLM
ncbi:DUF2182 domain-containing protein [Paraburkholderia rhynchosiae]|uniref:Metal-binding protein n=1 Tax=Paraburkholderia rhynchosiae TaxID=487049 RepID=A0A6J5BGA1_9BURK|nr:DUF2182 domain-containing protein [Paraburkholderia rhynchosiae]CAB3704420.1 hypothetical protein LMG27174_03858 [Paraburkholderia rhynchosiae]